MNSVKFLIISILSIACIDCLFFELSNSEEKCFIEELTIDNVLFIKYKLYEVAENSDQIKNIQIKISKGDGDEPLSLHSVKRIFGKHSFTAKDNGNYKICVFLSGSSIFNHQSVKMRLRFDSDGSEEKDLSETLQTSDVNFSTKHIKRIINKGIKVLDHQKYNIDREDNFSQAHMSYSKTFIYMTISQIVIVLVLGIYNIISFRNFLVQKNII